VADPLEHTQRVQLEAGLTDAFEAQVAPRSGRTLRVGLVVPQSGALGMMGPSAVDAALLAAHEVNVAGGVRGARVDLVLVDGGGAPAVVAAEAGRLCWSAAVDALVGFHTSDVHRAVAARVAGRVPYVFTPPHEGGRLPFGVVRTGPDPARQLRRAVGWLTRHHAVRRWALVGNDYVWPWAVHRAARRIIADVGAAVVVDRFVPLGAAEAHLDRLVDELRRRRADGLLVSLVGRDLVALHRGLQQAGLDRRLVRLSGALEENGLLAGGGDGTGLLYAVMPTFASLDDERHLSLAERHARVLGPTAPVLNDYAVGVYDGLRLVARLAEGGRLRPELLDRGARVARAPIHRMHLARADGLDLAVVAGVA
jgi:ABC-type branched-subunit amino acid transport system substrate-binding protein